MLADQIRTKSKELLESLARLEEELRDTDGIANAEQEFQASSDAFASANGELQAMRNQLVVESLALDQKRIETGKDDYLDQTPQRPWCRLYMDKTEAIGDGCPGTGEIVQPTIPDPYRQSRITEMEANIATLREQIDIKELALPMLEAQKLASTQSLQYRRVTLHSQQRQLWERIGHHRSLAERAARYQQAWNSFAELTPRITQKEQQIEDSLADQAAARQQLQTKLHTLSAHFDTTLKAILGNQVGGHIEINAKGILPRPDETAGATGAALSTSSTVLGFDIACLIASICGLGHHPRFLMHDSPREADMEAAIFHSQLRFARHLESLFGDREPSFQYIVTTTTPPPSDLVGENVPFIRSKFDARDDAQRLLGIRF